MNEGLEKLVILKKKVKFNALLNLLLSTLFLIILTPLTASAWARHNLITKYVLQNNEKYKNSITIVSEMPPDNSINPEYSPVYVAPDVLTNKVDCDEFVNYDLDNGLYYGFEGRKEGERTSIYEILVNFSDEPDWGMDKHLDLSFAQEFMAGSQGYRHMYYPFWTFHLPFSFLAQGEAPKRAQHFFDRAVSEYRKGNLYSAYRELTRSIHYVMDMAQPFHTRQLYYKLIQISSPFAGTVQAIKNYHFAYETFVANLLQMEDCGYGALLIKSIRDAEIVKAKDAKSLAILLAQRSNKIARRLIPGAIKILGPEFNSSEEVVLTESKFKKIINSNHEDMQEFLKLTQESLELTSGGIKGILRIYNYFTSIEQLAPGE